MAYKFMLYNKDELEVIRELDRVEELGLARQQLLNKLFTKNLTDEQLSMIYEHNPKWVIEHRPDWIIKHHPELNN